MTNYAVTDWSEEYDTLSDALAGLETKLETIDNTKTLRLIGITPVGGGKYYEAYLIYDA